MSLHDPVTQEELVAGFVKMERLLDRARDEENIRWQEYYQGYLHGMEAALGWFMLLPRIRAVVDMADAQRRRERDEPPL